MSSKGAVTMEDDEGRQYHIGLKRGQLAERVMLCGDVDRVELGKKLFEDVEFETQRREFRTVTGTFDGKRMSLMSTGIGPDNTEIAVIECCQIVDSPIFIRVGSCGALQDYIEPGDLVISTGALAYENTSSFFVPDCFPAIADPGVLRSLDQACEELGYGHHVGLTATTPGFYGSQGRGVGAFRLMEGFNVELLRSWGVLNFEMEASCLFRLATIGGARAGAVCAAFNNRITDKVISTGIKHEAEERCLRVAMTALSRL
jgi:uridine phosphorylase